MVKVHIRKRKDYLLHKYLHNSTFLTYTPALSHYLNMIVLTSLMFFLGIWVCENISKDLEEKDDKSIVVDELIGMWVALMPTIYFADTCLLYTSPSPRDVEESRMPSSA